jgi:hypothetical protein
LPFTCFMPKAICSEKASTLFSIHNFCHLASGLRQHLCTVLVLLVASTKHRETYKQQIKAIKNNTSRKIKQRTKRELAATVTGTQETPKMEL